MTQVISAPRHKTFDYVIPAGGVATSAPTRGAGPDGMYESLRAFARAAVGTAKVEEIEPGHWFAEAEDLPGAWGDGRSKDDAMTSLEESIVAWAEVKLKRGVGLPFLIRPHIESF